MPLLLTTHPNQQASFGLWKIEEPESFFHNELLLSPAEEADLQPLKGIRRAEWLAGRYLLHLLTGAQERLPMAKTAFAKPFFLDQPDLYCSLSHSHGIVGALLADMECGCDIQVFVDKMPRLAHKFINDEEFTFISAFSQQQQFELFHAYWTAKESLYKAYGLRELDFRKHLHLDHFDWSDKNAATTAWVKKGEIRQGFDMLLEKYIMPDEQELMMAVCFLRTNA